MSLADTRLLASRCPAWRRHELGLPHLHGTWEGVPGYIGLGWVETGRFSSGKEPRGIEYRCRGTHSDWPIVVMRYL